jgi:hypothetical protein
MADTYEQLLARLVEVADPPLPKGKPLTEMSESEARKTKITMFVFGLVFLGAAAYLYKDGHWVWGSIAGLLGLVGGVAAFSGTNRVGACPFCGQTMVIMLEDDRKPRQCEKCLDYLVYDGKTLEPLDPATVLDSPTFAVPLFKGARWPKACVSCGAPPTRLDDAKGRTLNAAALLLARVSVSSAEATGIPYCDNHKDAVSVSVGQDRKVTVAFSSIRMMRRYVVANLAAQRRKT